MYLSFYNLREWPFAQLPDTRFYYEANSHEQARRMIRQGILSRRGLIAVTGAPGTGKTLLADVLREELAAQVLFVHIPDASRLATNLLESIANQFGIERPAESRVSLPVLFHRALQDRHARGQITALLVDRADEVSDETLAALCLLAFQEDAGARLLQVVLCGGPDLDRRMRRMPGYEPRQDELRIRLGGLTPSEIGEFIHTRLRRAGAKPRLFSTEAVSLAYELSGGNPRAVNRLCDAALLAGFEAGTSEIGGRELRAAAAELGLAESPTALPETTASPAAVPTVGVLLEKLATERPAATAPPTVREREALEVRPTTSGAIVEAQAMPLATREGGALDRPNGGLPATAVPAAVTLRSEGRWLGALFVLLLAVVGGLYGLRQFFAPAASVPVSVQARGLTLANTAFSGKIFPSREWKAVAPAASVVREISVKIGDEVKAGQVLMLLDDTEARRRLEIAKIERDLARQERDQAARARTTTRPRRAEAAAVAGDVALAQRQAESVPNRQRQDSVDRARVVFEQARLRMERYEQLFKEGLVSRDRYEEQVAAYNIAETDLQVAEDAAKANQRLVAAQQAQKEKTTQLAAQDDVVEQQNRLSAVETAAQRLERAEAELKLAEQHLADCTVKATDAGYVTALPVGLGDQVASGAPLAVFARLDSLSVHVAVAAQLIDGVNVGDTAQVTLPTLPAQTVTGRVIIRNPVPDADGTHRVEIEISRPAGSLLVGQPAEVRFKG